MKILDDSLMNKLDEIKGKIEKSEHVMEGIEMTRMDMLGDCDCASGECDCDGSIWK